MKITSSRPRGERIYKVRKRIRLDNGRFGRRPYWIEPIGVGWWFDTHGTGHWVRYPESMSGMTTSYYSMRREGYRDAWSLKAALRLIHKWDVPKGTQFRVSLPYVGHTFKVTKP